MGIECIWKDSFKKGSRWKITDIDEEIMEEAMEWWCTLIKHLYFADSERLRVQITIPEKTLSILSGGVESHVIKH